MSADVAILCHRLHTGSGKWCWVDGAPNQQCLDDARTFGWELELACATSVVEQAATDAFHDGVILALQVLHAGGDCGTAYYIDLVNLCGLDALVKRATAEEMMELSGIGVYLRNFGEMAVIARMKEAV